MQCSSGINNNSGHFNDRILLLVDSVEIKDRVWALDILGQHLLDIYNSGLTADPSKDNSLKVPVSSAILTRCDDIAPEVRAQALTVLSRVAENIIKFFNETKDQTVFQIDDATDISDLEFDVNGEHRFFWYCMASYKERHRELMAVLHRRIQDNHSGVRKSAIITLEKMIISDNTFVNDKTLKWCFKSAFRDFTRPVRHQAILSLSYVLKADQKNSQIQKLWLKSILPLVDDPENSVQSLALSLLEELFLLNHVLSDENLTMVLLKKLTAGNFLAYHKFLKKAFFEWNRKNKLKPEQLDQLKKYVGTEWEECVWFYVSLFVKCADVEHVEFSDLCVQHLLNSLRTGEYPSFMEYVMKTFLHMCGDMPAEILTDVHCNIKTGLASFSIPVEFIPIFIEVISKIDKMDKIKSDFKEFSVEVVQKCCSYLSDIQSKALSGQTLPNEDNLERYFCELKEFFVPDSSHTAYGVIGLLKWFSGYAEFPVDLPDNVKAHVLVALGKISLQDMVLAKQLLPIFAAEVRSKHDASRSNAFLILIDMCKCYSSFTEICIPLISLCFKDAVYLIRYQTIILLIDLLQNGYKWKELLFFGFLSTLIDESGLIRELGHYAFCHLLPDSQKQEFLEYFIDSIFVLNYFPPPDNITISQKVRKFVTFSVLGEKKREERSILYTFFLEHMDLKEKVKAIESVCGIMTNVAESVYPLNRATECIIRDCFSILTCEEIKTTNFSSIENLDEPLEEVLRNIEKQIRRIILVDPVIKVVNSLERNIENSESNLFNDIILFLKDLLSDFTDDIDEILSDDKNLLRQLRLEIRNNNERKRMIIKRKKDLLTATDKGT